MARISYSDIPISFYNIPPNYLTPLEDLMTTATTTKPNVGDEIKVEVTGIAKKNTYDEVYLELPNYGRYFLPLKDSKITVIKPADDKHPIGTFAVDTDFGDRYLKVKANDWRYLNPSSIAAGLVQEKGTTWASLEARGAVILEKPAKAQGKVLDPYSWREYKRAPAGCTIKANTSGVDCLTLMNVTYGKETPSVSIGKNEALRLARDILATFA